VSREDLQAARRRFETSVARLDGALVEEVGRGVRWSRWAVPVLAAAVGLALGLGARRALPGRRRRG